MKKSLVHSEDSQPAQTISCTQDTKSLSDTLETSLHQYKITSVTHWMDNDHDESRSHLSSTYSTWIVDLSQKRHVAGNRQPRFLRSPTWSGAVAGRTRACACDVFPIDNAGTPLLAYSTLGLNRRGLVSVEPPAGVLERMFGMPPSLFV